MTPCVQICCCTLCTESTVQHAVHPRLVWQTLRQEGSDSQSVASRVDRSPTPLIAFSGPVAQPAAMGSSQDPGQALPVGSPDAGDAEEAHALASSLVPEQARQQTFVRARPSARQVRDSNQAACSAQQPAPLSRVHMQRLMLCCSAQRRRRKAAKQSSPAQTLIPAAAVVLLGALLYRKLFAGRKQRREAEPEGPDYSHLLEPCEITSSEEHSEGSTLPLLGLRLAVSPL